LGHGLRFLYPSFCSLCKIFLEINSVFCSKCFCNISFSKNNNPYVISVTDNFDLKVFYISKYSEPLKTLILRKNSANKLAARQLGQLLYDCTVIKELDIDYIVPIPLHWTRYFKRGFNQSCEMAKVLCKNLEIPIKNLLMRSVETEYQAELSHDLRQENVKGVFKVNFWHRKSIKDIVANKSLLLVDDLCTTGATLKNASQVLLSYKPKSICAVVACR
jgi:ComF family protein